MIQGVHSQIRTAEADDAEALYAFYAPFQLHAATLDTKREPILATVNELSESLGNPEMSRSPIFIVETLESEVLGFCGLRGMNYESGFGEVFCLFPENDAYPQAAACEALSFLIDRAAHQMSLRKVMSHCLAGETGYRAALIAQGFHSNGVMREVLYDEGHWHDIEALTHFLSVPTVTPAPQEGER